MNGYKIGEVSRVFGIPNETLRYYESRGIITPRRDEESGYRYYDVWDINFLLDTLWYRSYGFSLADVSSMVNSDSLETFDERYRQREAELIRTIDKYQKILKCLALHRQQLAKMSSEVGQFALTDSPNMVWQRQRDQGVIEKGASADHIRRWVELLPLVKHTFLMPELKPSDGEFTDYYWGFSASPEIASMYNLPITPGAQYIPSFKSIRTVFTAGGEGTFMDAFNTQVIEPIKVMGHTPSRPPVGNLLVRIHEKGKMKRYFEVWVPIE